MKSKILVLLCCISSLTAVDQYYKKSLGSLVASAAGNGMGKITAAMARNDKYVRQIYNHYPYAIESFYDLHESDFIYDQYGYRLVETTVDIDLIMKTVPLFTDFKQGKMSRLELMEQLSEVLIGLYRNFDLSVHSYKKPRQSLLKGLAHLAKMRKMNRKTRYRWWISGSGIDPRLIEERENDILPALRCFSLGFLFFEDTKLLADLVEEFCLMTHRGKAATAVSITMALAIAYAMQGVSPGQIALRMIQVARQYDRKTAQKLKKALDYVGRGRKVEEVLWEMRYDSADYVLAVVLFIFLQAENDFYQGYRLAVNSPGDSMAYATLVGALMGATLGFDYFSQEMANMVEGNIEMRMLANQISLAIRKGA